MTGSSGGRDVLADVRHQLALLARRAQCRVSAFTAKMPTEWRPTEVINPESNMPFTDAGAWELIATLLEGRHPLVEVELEKPAGKKGYVMIVELQRNCAPLYIKLQLGGGKVICRSFHLSTKEGT